jgi:hypothetical protein
MTLSRLWTLWLPLIFLGIQAILEISFSTGELSVLMSENGPVELLQWVTMVLASMVAMITLFRVNPLKTPWLFAWVLTALLSCLYVAGEEVSWGQHFLEWNTPSYWQNINDQNETNLHNVSSWLDQKPRTILLIGIIVGGLVFPLLDRTRPRFLPRRFSLIYPSHELILIALLVIGPRIANDMARLFNFNLFERVSEVQEVYMFYFVLLYLVVLRHRILVK